MTAIAQIVIIVLHDASENKAWAYIWFYFQFGFLVRSQREKKIEDVHPKYSCDNAELTATSAHGLHQQQEPQVFEY